MLLALILALTAAAAAPEWIDDRYADLESRTPAELFYLRNEIFARHGRTFESARLQARFEKEPWYSRNPDYSDDLLSPEELSLIGRIVALEREAAPEAAAEALLEEAKKRVPAGYGAPAGIGNVILGRRSPEQVFGVESFIGLPGKLGEVRSDGGEVASISFALSADVSSEAVEPKVRSLLTRHAGVEPRQADGLWTWEARGRVLSLSRKPGGLVIELSEGRKP